MEAPEKLMTVSDLKNFLQVSVPQIYLMIKRGMPYLTTGSHKRFVAQDVMRWMREQTTREGLVAKTTAESILKKGDETDAQSPAGRLSAH